MTITEFQAFIQELIPLIDAQNSTVKEILRNSIEVRLVAEDGYSLLQTEDSASRTHITVTSLYTYEDVTDITSFLHLAQDSTGINLSGQKSVTDGIFVKIPQGLETALANRGLQLQ